MNSRERILEAIKKNKPAETILPADLAFDALAVNLTEKYLQVLQGIGGKAAARNTCIHSIYLPLI